MNKIILPLRHGAYPVHILNSDNVYDKNLNRYQNEINENNSNGNNSSECNCEAITDSELDEILI